MCVFESDTQTEGQTDRQTNGYTARISLPMQSPDFDRGEKGKRKRIQSKVLPIPLANLSVRSEGGKGFACPSANHDKLLQSIHSCYLERSANKGKTYISTIYESANKRECLFFAPDGVSPKDPKADGADR